MRWIGALVFFWSVAGATPVHAQTVAGGLPSVLDVCFSSPPPSKTKVCQTFVHAGETYQSAFGIIFRVRKFDRSGVELLQAAPNGTYAGKIEGNRITGTATFGPAEYATTLPWEARFFSSPTADPGTGRYVYIGCADKVSAINTADHAVRTTDLAVPGTTLSALVASPDSKLAWAGTYDSAWKGAVLVIDGEKGAVVKRFPLADTRIPSGPISLALSGNASTLYAVGIGKAGPAIVAMDAATGAVRSAQPMPKGYTGGELKFYPRMIVSGTNLVLDDGTVVDSTVPAGPVPLFWSDARGLTAFPDGRRICASSTLERRGDTRVMGRGGVVAIGTKAIEGRTGCSVMLPDGSRTFVSGQQLRSEEGSAQTNPDYGAVISSFGSAVAITPDGKTFYTVNGELVYTIDAVTHWTTDALRVCAAPQLIAMPPLPGRL